jgi:hypothetical protein
VIPNTPIQPLLHDSYDAEHFVAMCRRELELHPLSPVADREPHPAVMDASTPARLRKQAA